MSKSSKKIRVGIVGVGSIGRLHAEKLVEAGAEVAAVCDIRPDRLAFIAKTFNVANAFEDYHDLVKLADLDAVTVGVPNYLHAPVALSALNAGKHVLCEKPMAMSVAQCKQMVAAARKNRRHLQIGFSTRYHGEAKLARHLVDAGKLGHVYHAVVHAIRRRGVPGRGGWFTTKAQSGGGPLIDIGVHMLDLTCWLMGKPRPVSVSAQTFQKFVHRDDYAYVGMWSDPVPGGTTDVEDYAHALIRFANGATVTLECAWAANTNEQFWQTQLLGDQAGLLVKPGGGGVTLCGQDGRLLTDTVPLYRKLDGHSEEFKEFVAVLRGQAKSSAPGADGQYTQALLDAIYRSAAAGKEVKVPASDLPG